MPDRPVDLILLPGLDGSDALFEPLRAALPASVRTHVLPIPADDPNTYDSLFRHLREHWPDVERRFVLAWCFSGPLGVRLAADSDLGVRALILAASFLRNPHPYACPFRFAAAPALFSAFPFALRARALLGGAADSKLVDLLRRAQSGLTGTLISRRVRAVLGVDETSLFKSLEIPVLYLASKGDFIVPNRNARQVADLNPRARIRTLRGPHLALASSSQVAAGEIAQFIAECTSA
jgi:pimeloyl-[acyl-carrier protein] methyl ester esterase